MTGLFLIPHEKASYTTFYIGKTSPIPNEYWIGYLSSIFSNLIISILIFFMILGEKHRENQNFTFTQIDTSSLHNFLKAIHKIVGLFLIGITFLLCLNSTIIAINFDKINPAIYILPITYFCFPFIFFTSSLAYFSEYYLPKGIKIIGYFVLIFAILLNDRYFFDIFGLNELNILVNSTYESSGRFALGYLKKTDALSFIYIDKILYPIYWYKKIISIILCLGFTFILSKIKIIRTTNTKQNTQFQALQEPININFNEIKNTLVYSPSFTFINLLRKDAYSFMLSVSKIKILQIMLVWILLFVVKYEFFAMLLPVLFLLTLFVNSFLSISYRNDIEYYEKISVYTTYQSILSQWIVVMSYYLILLVPLFMRSSSASIFFIFCNFSLLSLFQIVIVRLSKNNILMDIILIIIYSTYILGTPLVDLFQIY